MFSATSADTNLVKTYVILCPFGCSKAFLQSQSSAAKSHKHSHTVRPQEAERKLNCVDEVNT